MRRMKTLEQAFPRNAAFGHTSDMHYAAIPTWLFFPVVLAVKAGLLRLWRERMKSQWTDSWSLGAGSH